MANYVQQSQDYIGDRTSSYPLSNREEVETDPYGVMEEVVVCQLNSNSMFKVRMGLTSTPLKAIVDTAAEVTIISDRIYESLHTKPRKVKDVILNTADRNMKIRGMIAGPLDITLGRQCFQENIYVAPIEDDMLLGIDFLRRHKIDILIQDSILVLYGEKIAMDFGEETQSPRTSNIYIQRTTIVPPNSVKMVHCKMNELLKQFMFEPAHGLRVLVPWTVHDSGQEAELYMYMVNPTVKNVRLKYNQLMGSAEEVAGHRGSSWTGR